MGGIDDDLLDRHIPDPIAARGPLENAPSTDKLFRAVVDLVRNDRSQLYGAYFVLAAVQTDAGSALQAISEIGIDPDELATAGRAVLDETLASTWPTARILRHPKWTIRRPGRRSSPGTRASVKSG